MLTGTRYISITGLVLFGALFVLAAWAPGQVESAARSFIIQEAKSEAARYLDTPLGRKTAETYAALQKRYAAEIEEKEVALKAGLHEKLAEILSKMCRFDCDTQENLKDALSEGMKLSVVRLQVATEKIRQLAREKYGAVTDKLLRDLMIFTGSNSAIFAVLLLLTFRRPEQGRALAVPTVMILIATVASICIYAFGQDWFWVILTDNYMGYGYLAYVGAIFLFLCDIYYLKGQITSGILNAAVSILSKCIPG